MTASRIVNEPAIRPALATFWRRALQISGPAKPANLERSIADTFGPAFAHVKRNVSETFS